jgi:hypothetical protein
MVINRKVSGKALSMPLGLGIGLAVCMVLTVSAAAICTNLILNEKIVEGAIGYCAIVTLLIASTAGAWLAAVLVKRRWMIVCLGVGCAYFLSLLAITALFFGGQYQAVAVTALIIFGGCGAVGLLGLKGNGEGRKRRKKYHSR